MNKYERQGVILRLVEERELATQSDVAEALRDEGYEAVQTTISRDRADLGHVTVRAESGRLVYAMPGAADLDRLSELTSALRRWAISLTPAANLLVVHTPSGYASALSEAIDAAHLPELAGSIAGENTIMIAARDGLTGAELAQQFRHHLEGDT